MSFFVPMFRYIVVETNYRVYAYTDSSLQIALLGLFTEVLYRFVLQGFGGLGHDKTCGGKPVKNC